MSKGNQEVKEELDEDNVENVDFSDMSLIVKSEIDDEDNEQEEEREEEEKIIDQEVADWLQDDGDIKLEDLENQNDFEDAKEVCFLVGERRLP